MQDLCYVLAVTSSGDVQVLLGTGLAVAHPAVDPVQKEVAQIQSRTALLQPLPC